MTRFIFSILCFTSILLLKSQPSRSQQIIHNDPNAIHHASLHHSGVRHSPVELPVDPLQHQNRLGQYQAVHGLHPVHQQIHGHDEDVHQQHHQIEPMHEHELYTMPHDYQANHHTVHYLVEPYNPYEASNQFYTMSQFNVMQANQLHQQQQQMYQMQQQQLHEQQMAHQQQQRLADSHHQVAAAARQLLAAPESNGSSPLSLEFGYARRKPGGNSPKVDIPTDAKVITSDRAGDQSNFDENGNRFNSTLRGNQSSHGNATDLMEEDTKKLRNVTSQLNSTLHHFFSSTGGHRYNRTGTGTGSQYGGLRANRTGSSTGGNDEELSSSTGKGGLLGAAAGGVQASNAKPNANGRSIGLVSFAVAFVFVSIAVALQI